MSETVVPVRVGILGPLEVSHDGRAVEVGGARLRALLIRLALEAGRPVGIDALAEALWGDAQPADTANAVQSLVSRLRRAIPWLSVPSGPAGYRLDLPTDAVDANRFERLTREGRDALRAGDPAGALACLREALALWRGPALADVADAFYAAAPAARLAELRLTAQEDRIEAELRLGHPALLVAELEELTAAHPLRERLCVLRLRALAAAGRPAEALTAYEDFRRRLADELGVDPSAELREAHLALLRGDPTPSPTRHPSAGNLRAALTTFVGRDEELAQLAKQAGESRLVTLVGPGGAGKTRLACVAAAALAEGIGGGAWLVELAPITDPADVLGAVLSTVVRRDSRVLEATAQRTPAPRDAFGRLVDLLAGDDVLLVLDNCEHVVEAAARLADDLLARCPRLRILATSREPLGILGEALCPVPPLRLPEPGAAAVDALAYPSVQLLRDRAAAVRPSFAVSDDNVAAVVEICRRLDGLPLAIELAAARLRALSPEQVADRLDDRFRLLTGGSRTAMPRHRTLRAVVAWSWDLLSAEERTLAERLAVFPATITAESAGGVAESGTPVFELLDALVDKSLVQVAGDGRYRMLETIREYGLERLAERGDVSAVRAAHTAYFLRLVETAEPHLHAREQVEWLQLLAAERDNLIGALQFACDSDDADTALRIGAALSSMWMIHDDFTQAAAQLGRVLEVATEPSPTRVVIRAMYLMNSAFSGDLEALQRNVDVLVQELREVDPAGHPYLPLIEPALTLLTDDRDAGLAAVQRGFASEDPWIRAMLRSMRGHILENDGDAQGALREFTAAADGFRAIGERWGLANVLSALGDAYTKRGDFPAAIGALEESLRLLRQLNPDSDAGFQRMWLASVRIRTGDPGAREELERYVAEHTDDREGRNAAFGLNLLADLARQQGDLDEAAALYAAGWQRQAVAPIAVPQFKAILRGGMAHVAVARGDLTAARELAVEAMRFAVDGRDMPVIALTSVVTVAIAAAQGDRERAAAVLGASDSLRGGPDRSNPDAERLAAELRAALGPVAYEAAYARGHALGRADALALVDPA